MTDSRPPDVIAACERARQDIRMTIGTSDPSIVTNVIHALVTEHGDLIRLPREELAVLAGGAYRRLYGRIPHRSGR